MVLVDEPWYNEPGRERRQDRKASKEYNTLRQMDTMQHAMIYWLKERLAAPGECAEATTMTAPRIVITGPPVGAELLYGTVLPVEADAVGGAGGKRPARDDPIWGDVIRKHFAANGKAIMETVRKWKLQQPRGQQLTAELQEALARHDFV